MLQEVPEIVTVLAVKLRKSVEAITEVSFRVVRPRITVTFIISVTIMKKMILREILKLLALLKTVILSEW